MSRVLFCFKYGKTKVVTFSYDDGKTEDRDLVAMFNKYDLKGTFHINSGLFDDPRRIKPEEIKTLYEGHEVSTHTVTHPTIARSPREEIVQEILEDRRSLEAIVGYPVRGMSYPNGSYSEDIVELLPHLGIEYSRIVGGHQTYKLPENYHMWQSTCHHNKNGLERAKEFVALNKPQYLYMLYIWGHSYEFTNDNNWDYMEEICKTVSYQEDTWYATNIEIVDYMEALDRLRFNVNRTMVMNPSYQSVWLSVDGNVVEIPGGATISFQ